MGLASGLVPVHIGQPEPGSEPAAIVTSGRLNRRRPPRVPGDLDWQKHALEPRWLGMETSDCAVALEPGFFSSSGADERNRLLAGAHRRSETALAVAVIGHASDDVPRSPLWHFNSSVHVSDFWTTVSGRRLPTGTRPELASGLGAADRDLALRLLNRSLEAPWWSLKLTGMQASRPDGNTVSYEAQGQLQPILVDPLGDPIVAAWIPPAGDQRWYIVPDATNWDTILTWLTHHALPEYVPNALRRARSPHFHDPDLQTADELTARQALEELEADYNEEKQRLGQALHEAEAQAEPIRYGLLYETGAQLVRAVADVLNAAGLHPIDLDEYLGDTKSADLLLSDGPIRYLIEVKSAAGAAPESLVGHLERHLGTWPHLRPDEPVAGGVLIVNHQHKLHPTERNTDVYARPEFVAGLSVSVLSTVQLFRWWRTADHAAIRTAVLDTNTAEPTPSSEPASSPPPTVSRWHRLLGRKNQ